MLSEKLIRIYDLNKGITTDEFDSSKKDVKKIRIYDLNKGITTYYLFLLLYFSSNQLEFMT